MTTTDNYIDRLCLIGFKRVPKGRTQESYGTPDAYSCIRGTFHLRKPMLEALGNPTHVLFLVDCVEKAIAILPAREEDDDGRLISRNKDGSVQGNVSMHAAVSAMLGEPFESCHFRLIATTDGAIVLSYLDGGSVAS